MRALAMAYAMANEGDAPDDSDQEDDDEEVDSDIDDIDPSNFKGIYYNEDPNRKYQDPETGCHFDYFDLCKRLAYLKEKRKVLDIELGLEPVDSPPQEKAHIEKQKLSHKVDQVLNSNPKRAQHAHNEIQKKPSIGGDV